MQASMLWKVQVALVCLGLFAGSAVAQEDHKFNISGGGGFSTAIAHASNNLDTGWNLDFRGGYNIDRHLLADVDWSFNRWNLNSAALARAGQPGGYADVWSLTFEPEVRLTPQSTAGVYLVGGAGVYHRGLNFTQPTTFTTITCDPFFGYCYPILVSGNQVVASFSIYKFGYNVGAGVEGRLGHTGLKAFAEAKYNEMFTSRGPNMEFIPVTFGIRW